MTARKPKSRRRDINLFWGQRSTRGFEKGFGGGGRTGDGRNEREMIFFFSREGQQMVQEGYATLFNVGPTNKISTTAIFFSMLQLCLHGAYSLTVGPVVFLSSSRNLKTQDQEGAQLNKTFLVESSRPFSFLQ